MVYLTGDTHGVIDERFSEIDFKKNDYIIIAGDFGFLWKAERDTKETADLMSLKALKATILFIDGNHENFERLYSLPEEKFFGSKVGVVDEGIYHLIRGNLYEIDGRTFFTMGGGLSIDKALRIEGISYWKEEIPSQEEFDYALKKLNSVDYNVDYVLTHVAPTSIKRILLNSYGRKDITEDFLEYVSLNLKFKLWFFGHYHIERELGKFIALYKNWYSI